MRILYIIHDYLPRHRAGAEIYCSRLVRAMCDRGHRVAVFTTDLSPDLPAYSLRERSHDGVPVFEVNHLRRFEAFRDTWLDESMEARFEEVLEAFAPDAVHVHHLLYHSLRYPALARRRGLPVLFTLHDYALFCPSLRGGQLFSADGERCAAPASGRCAACLAAEAVRSPAPALALAGWLARAGALAPERLKRLNREVRRRFPGAVVRLEAWMRRGTPDLVVTRSQLAARRAGVASAVRNTDLFLAPSRHLRQRMINAGVIRARRVRHRGYGFLVNGKGPGRRGVAGRLSMAFFGTLAPHKGADVAIRAVTALAGQDGLSLTLYGSDVVDPAHVAALRSLAAADPRIRFAGPCDEAQVSRAMAEADLLVVPSVWEENSPLVVSEAFGAGLPVVASALGGLPELLGRGRHGPLFPPGDHGALAAILQELLHHPEKLADLSRGLPRPRSIIRDSGDQERILGQLIERHRSC